MAKWNLEKVKTFTADELGEIEQIVKRIRRKTEIMRLDQKNSYSPRWHDSGEILSLLDMLDRKMGFSRFSEYGHYGENNGPLTEGGE